MVWCLFYNANTVRNNLCSSNMIFIILITTIPVIASQNIDSSTNQCQPGFVHLSKKCYYFSDTELQWQAAHFDCEARNSTLAIIMHPKQDARLRRYLSKREFLLGKYERWIGAMFNWKKSEWVWGESGKPLYFQAFSGMNPVDKKWKWHCAILDPAFGNRWSARDCLDRKHYICQTRIKRTRGSNNQKAAFRVDRCYHNDLTPKEKRICKKLLHNTKNKNGTNPQNLITKPRKPNLFKPIKNPSGINVCPPHMILLGNKCYYFSIERLPFSEAHFYCEKNDTKLAIIKSEPQDDLLRDFLNRNFVEKQERWIGGTYNWYQNKWIWYRTGEDIVYMGFYSDIDPKSLTWHSIIMNPSISNRWDARLMTESKNFICQAKAKSIPYKGIRSRGSSDSDSSLNSNEFYRNSYYRV